MVTAVSDAVFVDTNILVFAHLSASPLNATALARMNDLDNAGAELWISRQIMREYLSAMTRPGTLTGTIPISSLVADVRNFETTFHIAEDGPTVIADLLSIVDSVTVAGKQIHDANIVATMQTHGIQRLLTHNVSDFTRYSSSITILPLIP